VSRRDVISRAAPLAVLSSAQPPIASQSRNGRIPVAPPRPPRYIAPLFWQQQTMTPATGGKACYAFRAAPIIGTARPKRCPSSSPNTIPSCFKLLPILPGGPRLPCLDLLVAHREIRLQLLRLVQHCIGNGSIPSHYGSVCLEQLSLVLAQELPRSSSGRRASRPAGPCSSVNILRLSAMCGLSASMRSTPGE